MTYTEEKLRKHHLISTLQTRQTVLDWTNRGSPTLAFLDTQTYTRTRHGVKETGVQKWSWDKAKPPSDLQQKKIIALVLMKAMETILTNHVYLFDNKIYRQRKGGPIGDNITNLSSKLVIYLFAVG